MHKNPLKYVVGGQGKELRRLGQIIVKRIEELGRKGLYTLDTF